MSDLYKPDEVVCHNCQHYKPHDGGKQHGFCLRYAPRPVSGTDDKPKHAVWPLVVEDWTCGDFESVTDLDL